MNAIEDNAFTDDWLAMAAGIEKPTAIVVISAHWQTKSPRVTASKAPITFHDYGGGSAALQSVQYPCPGAVELAQKIITQLPEVAGDHHRGLDHGCWSLLNKIYPKADIPTLQLSLANQYTPQQHIEFAKRLRWLRDEKVLVIGSGNIVHNIPFWMAWAQGKVSDTDWAQHFDLAIFDAICGRDLDTLANYHHLTGAHLAVPTDEHFLPLLYAAAIADQNDTITTSCFDEVGFESNCSRSIRFG
jgi:4,5-DOPA dioxygenase extradiol